MEREPVEQELATSSWGNAWERVLVVVMPLLSLWVAWYFFQRAQENEAWQQSLKLQNERTREFYEQLRQDNDAASENIEQLAAGKGNEYMEDRITEYTGKIRADQVLFPIAPEQVATVPAVAGLAEVVAYYQSPSRKPPAVTLDRFKQEEEMVLKALPPEPVLELESVEKE